MTPMQEIEKSGFLSTHIPCEGKIQCQATWQTILLP
jgi:hypothetical protein